MKAKIVSGLLGATEIYEVTIKHMGENHVCNQGCADGWCNNQQETHEIEVLRIVIQSLRDSGQLKT